MAFKFVVLIAMIGIVQAAPSESSQSSSFSSSAHFAADLFKQISKTESPGNVFFSPISIQTSLAMVYLGAEGETANQLKQGLHLTTIEKEEVGKNFAEILNAESGEAELNIANRFYISPAYPLRPTYNERAQKYFNSAAETINFSESANAVKTINTWVEDNTKNKITNLLKSDSVDSDTRGVIVNAIYFKGKWETPFEPKLTQEKPFWVSQTESVNVPTMRFYQKSFKYADLPEWDATALEFPYKGSDISMIVVLPNQRDGLANLEEKLSSVPINEFSSRQTVENVDVLLPKFKIEFSVGLVDVLKELGIRSIFDETSNLSGIFDSNELLKVSDVQHKAFIEVDESGAEAAAATYVTITNYSALVVLNKKTFEVDHPFLFAIKSPNAVYFVGRIVNP